MKRSWIGVRISGSQLVLALLLFATSAWSQVAILGAMPEEIEHVIDVLEEKSEDTIHGVQFLIGELYDTPVVVSVTGAGKINATIAATLLIEHFEPQYVIFTGVAGALNPSLAPGDIVIGIKTAHHDLVKVEDNSREGLTIRSPITGKECPQFFQCDRALLDAARRVEQKRVEGSIGKGDEKGEDLQIHEGTIVSGDAFVASEAKKAELVERLGADAVDMESAAVAHVCHIYATPFIAIRSFSDSADGMAIFDFRRFFRSAAHASSQFVMEMVAVLR